MGVRKLLKEGVLIKTKSGRKIYAFLCSDILVLTDEMMKTLYRMVGFSVMLVDPPSHSSNKQPIPLVDAQIKEMTSGRDIVAFQVSQPYPRGGDSILLKGSTSKDTLAWIRAIQNSARKCRHATQRASGRR